MTVAHVNGDTQKKGPAIILKVMAGDVVDVGVRYLYHDKTGSFVTGNVFNEILSSLAGGIVSTSGAVKGTVAELSNPVTSPLLGALTGFRQDNNQDIPGKPRAYLNCILVDEQFRYVNTFPQSGALPVATAEQPLTLSYNGIDITKNGYTSKSKIIFWNPNYGLKTTNGHILSPATGLDHEAAHTVEDLKHPWEFKKNTDKKTGADKQYDNKEDKRVIKGREQQTAKKLGEIKEGEVTRTDHKGDYILVLGPTSTKSAAEVEAERLLMEKLNRKMKPDGGLDQNE